MESLKLYWLGAPRVELTGQTVKLETRKAAALLCYLSLTPGNCQREILATMFWPDGSQQKALANLRRTLSSLNSSLPGWIEANRDTLTLKRNSKLWVDVDTFHQFLLDLHQHTHPEKEVCDGCLHILEKTIEMVRGEFLEGLNLTDTPDFDEWQFFQRDELRQKYALVLQQISTTHAQRSQWERAINYARRWVALDRLYEPAQRALIDLYIRAGQRVAAVRQYEEFRRLLRYELGQEPEEETQRLYEQARGQTETRRLEEAHQSSLSYPLLKTKLYIPAPPVPNVIRAHLLDRLCEIEKKNLTIISAPAGFGKTTLLAEWIVQTPLPIAWLSLDKGDNDLYRFLSYLIAALESVQEDIGAEARQLMGFYQLVPAHIILASLINDLGKIAESYVLVLDDYQFISEHIVHESVAYLLDHIPANMHIVIATRADPPLQLGRLRAHDQMLELRTRDLRFTPDEATDFLNEVMHLGLSVEDVEVLETRTEGWVVGLKMAALSLKGHENASKFIRVFSGSHRYVLDYLVEEVLKRQPAHVQAFLLGTSILEKLNGPLCDVLMTDEWKQEGENSQSVLEYLEHSNLFVIPLDDHKQWYRYHHLFADLLEARLQSTLNAMGVAQLHAHASDWYGQNGSVIEAIRHASLALDNERVERLIEQNYMEMVNRGEMSWLRFWTGELNKELIYSRPWLCIYEAQNHAWFGELEEAHRLLEEAEKRIQVLSPEGQAMLGHHAYVRSRVTAMRGDIHRAIELCLAARKLIPDTNLGMQLDISMTLGYEYFLNGDYDNAEPSLQETIRECATIGSIINTAAACCVIARLYAVQGLLHKSHDTYQMAAKLIPDTSGQHLGAKAVIEVGIADVLYEWNELEDALAHIKQGLALMPWWGKADDFILAYITLARIHLAQAQKNEAIEALEKASHLIQTRGVFSEARNAAEIAQVKLWLAQDDLQKAQGWATTLERRSDLKDRFAFEKELARMTLARVFMAQNKPNKAIALLSELEESARTAGRMGRVIDILLLKALALQETGDSEQAVLALTECLRLTEPEEYVRIFLDEGPPMQELLAQWLDQTGASPLRGYAAHLVSQFDAQLRSMTLTT